MYCCYRAIVEPLDRMVIDIYKEYQVEVEMLADSKSAHASVFVCDDRLFKYEWLTDKSKKRLDRVLDLENLDIPHVTQTRSTRVTRFGIIYEYKYHSYGDLFHAFKKYDFTWSQFDHVCMQLVNKLLAIHETGYCHNDIKPENLFLDNDMNVVFGDLEFMSLKKRRRYGTLTYQSPMHNMLNRQQVDLYALAKTIMVLVYFLSDKSEAMSKTVESAERWLKNEIAFASFDPCDDKWILFVYKATIENERGFNHSLESLIHFLNEFDTQKKDIKSYLL